MGNEPEPVTEDSMVAALLRERDSYVQRDMPDRVAEVDEQLALRGYQVEQEQKASPQRAAPSKSAVPTGRRAKPTSTAKGE